MIGAIGLAVSALSTVSSLVESAATSVSKAVDPPQQALTASAPAKPSAPKLVLNAGPPIPKFDKHTHAALLKAQEHLRV